MKNLEKKYAIKKVGVNILNITAGVANFGVYAFAAPLIGYKFGQFMWTKIFGKIKNQPLGIALHIIASVIMSIGVASVWLHTYVGQVKIYDDMIKDLELEQKTDEDLEKVNN